MLHLFIHNSNIMIQRKLIIRSVLAILLWLFLDAGLSQFLLIGLRRNYGLNQESEIIALGHSHLMMALDRKKIEQELGVRMSKYAREGMNMNERLLMAKQYMYSPYSDKIKWAIIGVDIYSFQGDGLSENSYLQFYPFIDDESIGEYVASQCTTSEFYQHKMIRLSRYSDDLLNSSLRGWLNDDQNRKTNVFDIDASEATLKKWMRPIGFNKNLENSLDSIIAIVNKPGVRTILLNTPTLYLINKYQPERYESIISHYSELAHKNDNVYFLDLNPEYQDSVYLFSDPVHMNVEGRKRVTAALIKYIQELNESGSK